MSTVETLEARIKQLEHEVQVLKDIEAIKELKGRYLRCLDSKLWDEIADCFTPDVTTSYSDGKLSFKGVDEVVNFFKQNMPPSLVTMHQCHTPEIKITSDTTATAFWGLQDYLIVTSKNWGIRGAAFYHEEYEKVDGQWKIKSIGYNRIFEERWDRSDPKNCTVTENMHQQKEE